MSFQNLIGNEQIKNLLTKTAKANKVSHSYLFCGIEGIGKLLFAKEFANMILCNSTSEAKPCGICKACVELESNKHPDYYEINVEESTIKIEQIRLMQSKILEKPIISNKQVYIINNADTMTKEAANCLLKTLEEPPEYVCIILIVSNENALLNTIKSRCTKVNFNQIENDILKQYIQKVYNILGDYPDVVANFLVNGILNNTKNNAKIEWLTNRKAAWRFMTAAFNKRDFFKE